MAEVQMDWLNFPVSGDEATTIEVPFGPITDDLAILIQYNPMDGPIRVIVGNGPDHTEAPGIVAEILRSAAETVELLAENPDYWAALTASESE